MPRLSRYAAFDGPFFRGPSNPLIAQFGSSMPSFMSSFGFSHGRNLLLIFGVFVQISAARAPNFLAFRADYAAPFLTAAAPVLFAG